MCEVNYLGHFRLLLTLRHDFLCVLLCVSEEKIMSCNNTTVAKFTLKILMTSEKFNKNITAYVR